MAEAGVGVAPDGTALDGAIQGPGGGTVAGAAHRPNGKASAADEAIGRLRALETRAVAAIRRKRHGRDANAVFDQSLTLGQRIADGVAATMGSWRFIIVQSVVLAVWVVVNVTAAVRSWDPYPFILLNLMLSFQAAYAAPIIMMSQNRQAAKDRLQAELDLNTDLKAEALIEELHGSVDDLRLRQWQELLAIQQQQIEMLRETVARLTAGGVAPGASVAATPPAQAQS